MLVNMIMRGMQRVLLVLSITCVTVYGGDWAVFKLRGSPSSKVTVSRYVAIPLKGNKQEYDFLGTSDMPCSVSLFAQSGQAPCWQLRRHPNQGMDL